jgi:Flp pilus assembly protein TadD
MRRLSVLARSGPPASLLRTALIAALVASGCASGKRPSETAKGEKTYGAKMARLGFWHEALFRFEKAAEIHPDDPQVQNDLAVAYESVGDTTHALAAYKRALELAPNDPKIKRNYARFAEYYTSVQRATAPAAPQ